MARKADQGQYWVLEPDDNNGYNWSVYGSQDLALATIASMVTDSHIPIENIILIRGVRLLLEAEVPKPAKAIVRIKK